MGSGIFYGRFSNKRRSNIGKKEDNDSHQNSSSEIIKRNIQEAYFVKHRAIIKWIKIQWSDFRISSKENNLQYRKTPDSPSACLSKGSKYFFPASSEINMFLITDTADIFLVR